MTPNVHEGSQGSNFKLNKLDVSRVAIYYCIRKSQSILSILLLLLLRILYNLVPDCLNVVQICKLQECVIVKTESKML